jgi:nitroreductase / dihydropteridine reductase
MNNSYLEAFEWRYATKKMNGQEIPEEKLNDILEAIRLSPSSLGFTPYTVLVIRDKETREKLLPHCYNQPQITSSSAVLVFAAWKNFNIDQVDKYIGEIAETRNVPIASLDGFAGNVKGKINNSSQEDLGIWAAKQTYIALGFGLAAAALSRVDSTPMEGFNPAGVDATLGLEEKGLTAACILALGYRDEAADFLATAKKVRRKKEELFVHI